MYWDFPLYKHRICKNDLKSIKIQYDKIICIFRITLKNIVTAFIMYI